MSELILDKWELVVFVSPDKLPLLNTGLEVPEISRVGFAVLLVVRTGATLRSGGGFRAAIGRTITEALFDCEVKLEVDMLTVRTKKLHKNVHSSLDIF